MAPCIRARGSAPARKLVTIVLPIVGALLTASGPARAEYALPVVEAPEASAVTILPLAASGAEVGDEQNLRPVALESPLGQAVETANGESAGRVIDVLADPSGQVRAAVIEFGGFLGVGSKKVAVSWNAVRFNPGTNPAVIVDVTRDQLRKAPEYVAPKTSVPLKSFY